MNFSCFKCSGPLLSDGLSRRDTCPKCKQDIKCCRNCDFYERGSYNECREPQAERVLDKETANMCDYFRPRSSDKGSQSKGPDLAALNDLFKK